MFLIKTLLMLTKILAKNIIVVLILFLVIFAIGGYKFYDLSMVNNMFNSKLKESQNETKNIKEQLAQISAEYEKLKNEDQIKKNLTLQEEIKNIHDTYQKAVKSYETLSDFKTQTKKNWENFDKELANALKQLSDRKFADATKSLETLDKNIQAERNKLATPAPVANVAPAAASAPTTSTPPGSGYQRINVEAGGKFTVDIISADLNSTKVIIDTASDSDCANDCPVMSLGAYASRSGAFAGINGNYFCPTAYPSCAGKTNSFDLLVMNKNKYYFNSGNNVYSTNPAVIFSPGSARFVGQALEWGRDTGVDGVISNYPLMVSGGNVSVSDNGGKGLRSFVSNKGSMVYIGYVHGASLLDAGNVLKALGMDNALNLDQGGSTALWTGGHYVLGPGRDIPTAILFVNR